MKKVMTFLVCLLAMCTVAQADNDVPIRFDQLPAPAQAFIKQHFPNDQVSLVKLDNDWFDKSYEVILANTKLVKFLQNGEWEEVDCRLSAVPAAIIPLQITQYVNSSYPGQAIIKIEQEKYHFEVRLTNGIELKFDRTFNIIDIDY